MSRLWLTNVHGKVGQYPVWAESAIWLLKPFRAMKWAVEPSTFSLLHPAPPHWCLAANLRICVLNTEMVFNTESTDFLATVGQILMTHFDRTPWNFDSDEMQKTSAPERTCAQNSHNAYSRFWPIGAYSGPNVHRFFLFWGGGAFLFWGSS